MIYKSKLNDKYELLQSEGECCYEDLVIKNKKTQGDIIYILSDDCIYLGTESQEFQCGFVVKDKKVEDKIKRDIFNEDVTLDSEYTDEFIDMMINYMNSFVIVNRLDESILRTAFKEDEDGNGFYDSQNASLDINDLHKIKSIVESYLKRILAIENQELKEFFLKAIDEENAKSLLELCNGEKIIGLTKEDRKNLIAEAEKDVLDLYERLAGFQEEIIGIFEEIIEA